MLTSFATVPNRIANLLVGVTLNLSMIPSRISSHNLNPLKTPPNIPKVTNTPGKKVLRIFPPSNPGMLVKFFSRGAYRNRYIKGRKHMKEMMSGFLMTSLTLRL
jgi:hypothetical protein